MSKPTSTSKDASAPAPVRSPTIPVDALVVDSQGRIHFAASDYNFLGKTLPFHIIGANLSDIFTILLTPVDYQKLCVCIAKSKTGSFSLSIGSTETPSRSLSIIGHPFSSNDLVQRWLLITQDITTCQAMIDIISTLETTLENIRQTEKSELDKMTKSLIDTNVALRKEVRDRQNTFEKLSVSEARFRDLTETTSDFIWEINNAGNYTYASPKSVKLLGLEPLELLGTPLFLFRKIASTSEFIKNIELRGQPQHGFSKMEYSHTRQDGLEVTVESSGEPIFSKHNKFIGFRGIDRDVTERRIYETKLKHAKEMAESANLAKSEFLANMSHELRTPLHAILSFAKYGEKRIESASRKELFRFFSQIASSGQRLLPLIDSLLDLAKLESGKMTYDFQYLDIMVEIRSAIHEITPLAEKKGLSITFDLDNIATVACFDQAAIAQVIRNLLANGVKFSNQQTPITISFKIQEDLNQKSLLKTTISNFGVAIPAIELGTIFDKFAQSTKTKTGAGGTGLGLSICKQIIEDHGGTIWASHGENGDTQFHFTLPIQR
ncbi:MAG: PAS domain-containing sensor histidine kinase [Proteobacteria bacterium]|nr:PAS domain-containing sensor histidine kinase [Pseudomonadota bacterium]